MRILLLIPSLRGGGAERVASILCSYWAEKLGLKVDLLTFDTTENDFYTLNSKVIRHSVGLFNQERTSIYKRILPNIIRLFRIRTFLRSLKPDIIIGFMPEMNVLSLLSALGTGIPVVISERIYPPYYNDGNMFDIVRKLLYKFSDAFVSQTNCTANWARDFLKATKIAIIPNPIKARAVSKTKRLFTKKEKTILAVGRLHSQKGFDKLIDAYNTVHKTYPEWKLCIVGEGEERKRLEAQITRLRLNKSVTLAGQTTAPDSYYKSSEIFVLSSMAEGFPNVLLEAMGYGLPVISFDCKAGPSDLIDNENNGLLVPIGDVKALSKAMIRLIKDKALRKKLSNEAAKVRKQFSINRVSEQWIGLFKKIQD